MGTWTKVLPTLFEQLRNIKPKSCKGSSIRSCNILSIKGLSDVLGSIKHHFFHEKKTQV